jgi:hypothetical protein
MLHRDKVLSPTSTPAKPRYTIKLDAEMYYALDKWKAKIRIVDPANRITVTDIVRHGIAAAIQELEAKYGKLDE